MALLIENRAQLEQAKKAAWLTAMPEAWEEFRHTTRLKEVAQHPPVPAPTADLEYNLASPVISYIKGEIDNHSSESQESVVESSEYSKDMSLSERSSSNPAAKTKPAKEEYLSFSESD
jgi:hypothetical protein